MLIHAFFSNRDTAAEDIHGMKTAGINLTELGVDEFCGAGFPIYETINSQKYKSYELEFTSEYIFVTKAEFTDLGIFFYFFELGRYFSIVLNALTHG